MSSHFRQMCAARAAGLPVIAFLWAVTADYSCGVVVVYRVTDNGVYCVKRKQHTTIPVTIIQKLARGGVFWHNLK